MSEMCSLKEEGLHTITAGRSRKQSEETEQRVGCVSVSQRAGAEVMQRVPGDVHTHYWYYPQEELACQRLEVTTAGTLLPAIVQEEIQSLGERRRIRGDVFKEEGIHFFPFLFHLKSRNWLSACVLTVISDAVSPQGL